MRLGKLCWKLFIASKDSNQATAIFHFMMCELSLTKIHEAHDY
jgi:hypothetical protein